MPDIPYTVFHCTGDKSVNLEKHSERFVNAMKETHDISFNVVPLRGHCDLSAEASLEYMQTIINALN